MGKQLKYNHLFFKSAFFVGKNNANDLYVDIKDSALLYILGKIQHVTTGKTDWSKTSEYKLGHQGRGRRLFIFEFTVNTFKTVK